VTAWVPGSWAGWVVNEQAVKKAKTYLSFSSFSLPGMVQQLQYDEFTPSEAQYGASTAYGG
jgi:hypothetical protein